MTETVETRHFTLDPHKKLTLVSLLQLEGLVMSGGHAKRAIEAEQVLVNGVCESRKRRQLQLGDVVTIEGVKIIVV